VKYLIILALAVAPAFVRADEKDDALAKQKEAAAANWKRMEFKDAAAPVETPNLIVYAHLPEAKTKPLAAGLEKFYAAALKPLKYGGSDIPWPGKLAVYVLPERDQFVDFMRKVAKKSPGEDETGFSAVAGDAAYVVVGAPRVGTSEVDERGKAEIGAVLLRKKMGGADPPDWLVAGFAKATMSRIARPTARAMATAPGVPFKALWEEQVDAKSKQKIATYLVDYLAYGPASDVFPDFINALKSDETTKSTWKDAYDAVKMDETTLEYCARNWKKPPANRPAPTPTKPKKDKP
jgi:hypothetical protein